MNWRIYTSKWTNKAIGIIGVVCVCWLAVSSGQAAVVGYWRFETDGGSGVTAGQSVVNVDDSSGNIRTGTALGSGLTYASTPFANVVPQTGAANLYALNPNADGQGVLLSGAAATGLIGPHFTIEAFIELTSTAYTTGIFRSRDLSSSPLGLSMVDSSGLGEPKNDIQFSLTDAGISIAPDINLQVGVTYHVAATYDGSTASLYVDGTLVGSATGTGFTGTDVQSAIGADPEYPSGYNSSFLGFIDEFRISDEALAPAQFLDAIPEPATVMLLGLGGLLIFHRRSARKGGQGR